MSSDKNLTRLRTQMTTLLEAAREQHEKLGLALEEMETILGGGVGIGAQMRRLIASWRDLWATRYRGTYSWNGMIDGKALKKLIQEHGADEVEARLASYVKDGGDFLVQNRHPFQVFVRSVNQYAGVRRDREEGFDLQPPADCHHTPRCRTDKTHTDRAGAERRAHG